MNRYKLIVPDSADTDVALESMASRVGAAPNINIFSIKHIGMLFFNNSQVFIDH